ncbi:DUF5615 family PIN-like protein [Promineifilum sp.]|uniref:DUF5615 family PIN-like protein n=1 Tax=Promineifilum sp. TaxID=2664178 RepID=UPI0035B0B941
MTLHFLLDENISPKLRDAALRQYPHLDVLRVGDPGCPPLQSPDDLILEYLVEAQRVLVTNNRKSMPGHVKRLEARGLTHWGIFRIRPRTTYQELIDALLLFNEASAPEEWVGAMRWIPF